MSDCELCLNGDIEGPLVTEESPELVVVANVLSGLPLASSQAVNNTLAANRWPGVYKLVALLGLTFMVLKGLLAIAKGLFIIIYSTTYNNPSLVIQVFGRMTC